ncbi:MAG: PAS domain S-box protein, partial [Flavobacteriales bacterium]|nr:PAS domain S-box protein [Flavobacteriales bacterium]
MASKNKKGSEAIHVQSERSFEHFLDRLAYPSVIHVLDKYVYANQAAANLFRVKSPKDIIGSPPLRFVHPDNKVKAKGWIKEVFENGSLPERESLVVDSNGVVQSVIIAATLITYKGKPSILASFQNIDVQRDFKEKLEASEKQYRQLVENVNEGIIKFDLNEVITYVNRPFCEMVGYTAKELLGKVGHDLLVATKESRKIVSNAIKERKRGKSSKYEVQLCTKSGILIWASMNGTPIFDDKGNFEGSMGIVTDITDIKKNQEELKQSEERYRTLNDSAFDAIIIGDERGKIISWNNGAEMIFGYKPEEIIGKSLTAIMPRSYREQHTKGFHRYVTTKKPVYLGKVLELKGIRKNGEEFPLEINLTSWETASGQFFSGIVRDITERKKTESALIVSEERLNNFMNSAADIFTLLDKDLNLLEINNAGLKLFGLKASEKNKVIGKNIEELSPDIRRSGMLALHKKVLKTGKPCRIEDIKVHPKFGEKWFVSHAFRVGDGIGIIGRDISERKKVEQAIEELNETLEQRVVNRTIELEKEIVERHKTEEHYQNLVETLTYGVEDIDSKGKILFANEAMHRMYGYKNGELIGQSILDFVATDTERRYLRQYMNYLVKEKPRQVPYYGEKITKKGKVIDVVVDWNFRLDKNKKVVGFSSVITDITEKKRAEKALTESEAQFRSLSENSPVLIISLDRKGNISYANRALKGLKMKEVMGSSVYNLIHPDARKTYKQHLNTTFKTGEVSSFELQGYGDNNDIRWFSNRMAPIKSNGKVNTVVLISLDITESKTASIRIKASEGKYRRLVETMNEGLIQVDNKDRIVFVNGRICEMSGYTEEELIGQYAYKMLLPTRSKKEVTRIAQERKNGVSSQYEIQLKIKSGELRWFIIDGAPVYDVNGKIIGSVGVHLDITHRKTIEVELQKSVTEKDMLLKEMHHRVKNNLQIVSSLLNMQAASIPNELVADALRESQDRIQTMAFIHESLYLGEAMSDISIKKYLEPLIKDRIKANAEITTRIDLITDFPDAEFSIERMLPLGLLMNELITN